MNVSNKVQYIWWAPPRTGSRAMSEMLKFYEFYNYELSPNFTAESDIKNVAYTHTCTVPPGKEGYKILMQVRNPYSRAVSMWHLACFKQVENELIINKTFEEYINTQEGAVLDRYENAVQQHKPSIFVRYENFVEDIKNIPFINFNDPAVVEDFNAIILNNKYKYEGVDDPRGDLKRTGNYADWKFYYKQNESLANIIYNKYPEQFKLFGYSKDSWK